uniref:Uncharacterized protein n=1 Tax=Lactuca sativa TaxID=4236 RepID=A0A9R1WKR7_LACSA|nr:hypothetical protein LSAT_V11C100027530 [Lactuca sativa]
MTTGVTVGKFLEITSFLCKHTVCAIWNKTENGANVPDVHPCYRLSTSRAMYLIKIDPVNGRSMWPKSNRPFTLTPPKHHTQVLISTMLNIYFECQLLSLCFNYNIYIGRPKKRRRRGVDEPKSQPTKLSRKFLTVTCSKCHNKGHSYTTCKR